MTGRHRIIIRNRKVSFTIELERNITVIRGDSATGKTTLIRALEDYEELGAGSGVTINSDKPCVVLSGKGWMNRLAEVKDSFVFCDEGNGFITSEDFAREIRNSDNYYILVTRESLFQLPYSVDAVLELRKTTSRFKRTYNRSYPYYDHIDRLEDTLRFSWGILTEDSNAGFEFYAFLAGKSGICCVPAGGKSSMLKRLRQLAEKKIVVTADGAAFGAEMDRIYQYAQLHPDQIVLYLPESFEWLILKSGIVSDPEISDILESPSDHIESSRYFSWEQFFTELLIRKTAGTYAAYRKASLNRVYLRDENVQKLEKVIESPGSK